jgi:hypothetical protein
LDSCAFQLCNDTSAGGIFDAEHPETALGQKYYHATTDYCLFGPQHCHRSIYLVLRLLVLPTIRKPTFTGSTYTEYHCTTDAAVISGLPEAISEPMD